MPSGQALADRFNEAASFLPNPEVVLLQANNPGTLLARDGGTVPSGELLGSPVGIAAHHGGASFSWQWITVSDLARKQNEGFLDRVFGQGTVLKETLAPSDRGGVVSREQHLEFQLIERCGHFRTRLCRSLASASSKNTLSGPP
jgi:hypothetical protein